MTLTDYTRSVLATLPSLSPAPSGQLTFVMYPDSHDSLTSQELATIIDAKGLHYDALIDLLDEAYVEAFDDALDELLNAVRDHWDDDSAPLPWDATDEDTVREIVRDAVNFVLDYNHFLRQTLYLNILINTGDGHADFTHNNWCDRHALTQPIPDDSGLLWLARSQGYSDADVERAIRAPKKGHGVFLDSVIDECANTTSPMNALTFFVRMTVGQFVTWLDSGADLTVSEKTACGLWDPWTGGGSLLEITLERAVTIPFAIAEAAPDGVRSNYDVADTYGMLRRFWTDTVMENASMQHTVC